MKSNKKKKEATIDSLNQIRSEIEKKAKSLSLIEQKTSRLKEIIEKTIPSIKDRIESTNNFQKVNNLEQDNFFNNTNTLNQDTLEKLETLYTSECDELLAELNSI